jgi:trypsin
MKFIFLVISFLFAVASSSEDNSKFIVGGRDATIEEFPYMAKISNLGWPSCGGAIINSRSVLSAAHCVFINLPVIRTATLSVSVGSSRRWGQGGTTHRVLRVFIHPDYKLNREPFILKNDVAVIRTITRIQFGPRVQPIPLGTDFVSAGSQITATGWGLIGEVNAVSPF